jgi:hypothetical protein
MKKRSVRLLFSLACLLAAGLIQAPARVSAAAACGSCSYLGCRGAMEGRACTTFSGAPGHCYNTGKLCGDHAGFCGCYAP